MPSENVEKVQRALTAFARGDLDGLVADFAPDVEYVPSGALPGGDRAVQGREECKRSVAWLTDEFDDAVANGRIIGEAGGHVVVELTFSGRGKRSGIETQWTVWQVWTIRDGQLVRGRGFTTEQEALEAAGDR